MAAPKLTLTSEQTAALLRANPFGPMTWARQVMSAEDALSFAVHTGLVNIDIRPLCPCGQRKYLTATENRAGSFCHAICKRHGTNATPDGIRYSFCWWILHIPWILLPPSRQRIRPTLTALAVSRDGPKTREKSLIRCECPLSARRVNLPHICICYCHTCLPIPIFPSHSHFHFTSHHITWFLVVYIIIYFYW